MRCDRRPFTFAVAAWMRYCLGRTDGARSMPCREDAGGDHRSGGRRGGTHVLGGRGRCAGTLVGVIMIVLPNSVLSIMQMPEAFRRIIYGSVIVGMLLAYGRGDRVTS